MKKFSVKNLLLIALAVFFVGLIIASSVATNGGKTEHRRLSVMTDRGVAISLEVFKPKTATRENPAPTVMLIPGGNASVEYMNDAGLELARRGIIAIGIEPYTIGRSDVEKDNQGLGSVDVTDYVYHLDFVDTNNIGYIGWSMGPSRVNAAMYVPDPSGATEKVKDMFGKEVEQPVQLIREGVKGVMYVGAGSPLDPKYKINSSLFEGQWDNLYRGDRREMYKNPQYAKPLGVDQFEFWKWYGDPNNGTGRIIYEGWTGHTIGLSSYTFVKAACDFYTTTFKLSNDFPILFLWKEFGTAIAFIAIIVALICGALLLLDTEFFKKDLVTKERTVVEASPKWWLVCIGLVLPALFGAATAAWAVPTGQGILNKWVSADLIHGTNIQNVNGLVFWLCCLQLFGLVLWFVMNFVLAKTDKKALKELKTAGIVCTDPDNGLVVPSAAGTVRENKSILSDEIRDYYLQGSSVIYYQHKARKKDPYYIDQHKRLLEDPAFTGAKGLILKFKKTSLRYYCFIIQPDHQDAITEAINKMLETAWGDHFSIL